MQDFSEAYRLTSEFMENQNVVKYWRTPLKLFKEMNWHVIFYKNSDSSYLTAEGYSCYKNGNFFILCAKDNPFKNRITFNLHHEGGHIVCLHTILYESTIFKSEEATTRVKLEREASLAGRNIFIPAYIVNHILENENYDYEMVKNYFCETYKISRRYMEVRFSYLAEDLKNIKHPDWLKGEAINEYSSYKEWKKRKGYFDKSTISKYIDEVAGFLDVDRKILDTELFKLGARIKHIESLRESYEYFGFYLKPTGILKINGKQYYAYDVFCDVEWEINILKDYILSVKKYDQEIIVLNTNDIYLLDCKKCRLVVTKE